jgi:hypothetical protein
VIIGITGDYPLSIKTQCLLGGDAPYPVQKHKDSARFRFIRVFRVPILIWSAGKSIN